MRAILSGAILLAAWGSASAQDQVTVKFDKAAVREVWAAKEMPNSPPKDAIEALGSSVGIMPPPGSKWLFAWDRGTGNIASAPLGKPAWSVRAADERHVAFVLVRVESSGKPVAAAQVTLTVGGRSRTALVDPASKGQARFFGVPLGSVKVRVDYRSGGDAATPVVQEFRLDRQRSTPEPTFVVSVPGLVEVVGAKELPKTPTPAAGGANPVGSAVVILIALAIAGGIAFFAVQYAKRNSDLVGQKLEQLGVQIPKPGDEPDPDPGPPPAPPKPEPPARILLGADADPVARFAAAPTGELRLVGSSGAFEIPEGETVVGRDVEPGLGLSGDSTVSRRHARLWREGGRVVVSDLGSTNGTFVQGVPVTGERELRRGDEVRFGSASFRFEA